jgi:hypothetical protein
MMLFNRDSAIQSATRRFCTIYKSENFVPYQPSGRRVIPSRCPTVQSIIRPDDENFPSRPSTMSRSFKLLQLASVRTFQQHVRTTLSVRQASDFFPKHSYGKIATTVRTTWIPVLTSSSTRQVSHSKSRRPDTSHHGLDARASDMKIVCIRSTAQTTIPLFRTRKALV